MDCLLISFGSVFLCLTIKRPFDTTYFLVIAFVNKRNLLYRWFQTRILQHLVHR